MRRRIYVISTTAIWVPLFFVGCKDTDPPPILSQDLGTAEKPLVLPSSTFHNVAIVKGQADWVPFREPGTKPDRPLLDSPTDEDPSADADVIEEIQAFIADYNALSDEGDFEELQTYVVESQSAAVASAFSAAASARTKLDSLKTILTEKLSDQTDRIEATLSKMRISADQAWGVRLKASDITVISADELTAKSSAGSLSSSLKFVVIDDAWYLEFSDLPDAESLTKTQSDNLSSYDGVIAKLSDGTLTAEQILTSMEDALATEEKSSNENDDGQESNVANDEDESGDASADENTSDN